MSEICSPDVMNLEPPDALIPLEHNSLRVKPVNPTNVITSKILKNTIIINRIYDYRMCVLGFNEYP
jgi:hypothetical protein